MRFYKKLYTNFYLNVLYTMLSNIIPFAVSVLSILVIPKVTTLDSYGQWQYFLFCFSFVGCFHFGWLDGIYLRYVGEKYENLLSTLIPKQFIYFFLFETICSVVCYFFALIIIDDLEKRAAVIAVLFLLPIANYNSMINIIFQATSRFKTYAKVTILEPLMFLTICCAMYFSVNLSYSTLLIAKTISLLAVFGASILLSKDITIFSLNNFRENIVDIIINIKIGFKLLISNLSNMIILGVIRYGISIGWDLKVFGKVSLTLTISNFFLMFINAISVVLTPYVKNKSIDVQKDIYLALRSCLNWSVYFLLSFFYPLKVLLIHWLPTYADVIPYIAVIFPICVFESRMGLLINTYYKALRKESAMLTINFIVFILAIILTVISIGYFQSLLISFISIIVTLGVRCTIFEFFLLHFWKLVNYKYIFIDVILTSAFVYFNYNFSSILGTIYYFGLYLVLLILNIKTICYEYNRIR